MWLHTEILKGNINAPSYLKNSTNFMVVESYNVVRFIGTNMPNIDPVKEVKAVVEMLSKDLISYEQAAELLNIGDWSENFKKLEKEKKIKGENEPVEEDPDGNNQQTLKVATNG